MSRSSITRPSQGVGSLMFIAAFLNNAHHRDDNVISFPANTSEAILQARPRGMLYDMQDVQAIVLALELPDSTACKRLDSLSLTILCSIFIYSQDCLAQQRGLCLLARALHRNERDAVEEAALKLVKKLAIGRAALTQLIKGFLNTDATDKLRRWLGILALELLEDCPDNVEKLGSDPPEVRYWQQLSNVIEFGSSQVLKLLAGSMIREMLSFGVLPNNFWQSGSPSELGSKFPRGQRYDSQWVTSFEEFVDELVPEKDMSQKISCVMFAHAVHVGDQIWNVREAPDILVTLSEELNIIIPANKTRPAVYIDVPLDSVLEVSLDNVPALDSQQVSHKFGIGLDGGSQTSCIVNAIRYAGNHMEIHFGSEKDAKALERLLVPTNLPANRLLPHYRSGANEALGQGLSDDELAGPVPAVSDSQSLVGTASLADTVVPNTYTMSTINPAMLERVHDPTDNREGWAKSLVENDEDPQNVGHILQMAVEGIDVSEHVHLVDQANEGIDVSQNDDSVRERFEDRAVGAHMSNHALSIHKSQALNDLNQDRKSGNETSNSLHGRSGLLSIHDKQESHVRPSQKAVASAENANSPDIPDRGHDNLYNASPKPTKGHRRSPRLLKRNIPTKNLDSPLQSTLRQPTVEAGSSNKLVRRPRNANRAVESFIEQRADYDLASLTTKDSTYAQSSTNGKKSKVSGPANVKAALKSSSKTNKKTALSKGKAIGTEEPPSSRETHQLSSLPMRIDSATKISGTDNAVKIRPKPTKAPDNSQKKAKPMPTKASDTTLAVNSTTQKKKSLKSKVKANGSVQDSVPSGPSSKGVDYDEDAIWDVNQAYGEEEPEIFRKSGQLARTAKKKDARVSKTKKTKADTELHSYKPKISKPKSVQDQNLTARVAKIKPAPATLSRSRPRRAAAIKANNKIQGLEESDGILTKEEIAPALTGNQTHAPSIVAKMPEAHRVKNNGDDPSRTSGKLPSVELSTKSHVSDSVSPGVSEMQRPESVAEPKVISSPENADVVGKVPTEAIRASVDDKRDAPQKDNPSGATETSVVTLTRGHGNELEQRDFTSREKIVESSKGRVGMVPDIVPKPQQTITEIEPALARSPHNKEIKQGNKDLEATKGSDSEDQSRVERVQPRVGDVSHEVSSRPDGIEENTAPSQVPTTSMAAKTRQKGTSPQVAEAIRKLVPKSIIRGRDPFAAKLNASMLQLEDVNTKTKGNGVFKDNNVGSKGSSASKPPELEDPSRKTKARAPNTPRDTSSVERNQSEKYGRRLKSAMQVDGEDEKSQLQPLKRAGEALSASGVEVQRKIEQAGDASNKRVKIALHTRMERASPKRNPHHDAKKTPPPAASKKPLMIGFSSTGPRNQGISTKKPKPPENIRMSVPKSVKLRRHLVPISANSKAEAGSASVRLREALAGSPEVDLTVVRDAAVAQEEVPNSTAKVQGQDIENVRAIASRQANTYEYQAEKRKLTPFLDEHASWEHEPLSKRQKGDIRTPPTAQKDRPRSLKSPVVIYERSQRLSSQNTRVNENGSPMPYMIIRNENRAVEEQYSDEDEGKDALAEARREEELVLQDDDRVSPESVLLLPPVVSGISVAQSRKTAHQGRSTNSKQVPSSPHASSAFGTIPPHHLCQDGELVNAETKKSIVPTKPQDPFVGAFQKPPNSFMNALHKSTLEFAAKGLKSKSSANKKLGGLTLRRSPDISEDPDKTLVESNSRIYQKPHASETTSSWQSGSSMEKSQPNESPEEDSEAEREAKWRQGLEPHQENMLECLLAVSHRLVRHLIDKEEAVKDMVTDFANQSTRLVESFERGLQEQLDSLRADNDQKRQDLVNVIEKAQADQAMTRKAVVQRPLQAMHSEWKRRQESLMDRVAAAREACAGRPRIERELVELSM